MINCLDLTSRFLLTISRNYLFKTKNKTECLNQDLAFVICGQICGIKIMSSIGPVLVILNRI